VEKLPVVRGNGYSANFDRDGDGFFLPRLATDLQAFHGQAQGPPTTGIPTKRAKQLEHGEHG
jgi:hypothetical protein